MIVKAFTAASRVTSLRNLSSRTFNTPDTYNSSSSRRRRRRRMNNGRRWIP
jgi:hypothetical protein